MAVHAAAQDPASVTFASQPDALFHTDLGTLQGVALHGDNVLTQATTRIAVYHDGALLRSRDTTADGSYGAHNGDGAVLAGKLYISTSNYPTPLHERRAAISIYDASSLAYLGEWTPQGTQTGAGGGVGARSDGSLWWPFAHKECQTCPVVQVIHELDQAGTIQRTFPLTSASGTSAYQSCDWLPGALLLCPNHGGQNVDYSDLYHFDGTSFAHHAQVPHVSWTSTNQTRGTEYGSQGFAVQVAQDGSVWTWWAGRDVQGNGHGTGDLARFPTTFTSPTPPTPPTPPDDEDPADPDPPGGDVGGGGVAEAATYGWGITAALAVPTVALLAASQHHRFRARVRAQPVTFAVVLLAGMVAAYSSLVFVLTSTAPTLA